MAYVFLLIALLAVAAIYGDRQVERIKTRKGWLKINRCSERGVTFGFQPFNNWES